MFKTPASVFACCALVVSASTASLAGTAGPVRGDHHAPAAVRGAGGIKTLDGRMAADPSGDADGWDLAAPVGAGADRENGDAAAPSNLDLGAATRSPDPAVDPLSEIGLDALPDSGKAADAAAKTKGGSTGLWLFLNQVRYGGLPEPASWALILFGFGVIGAALRGFVLANRRLARLQTEDDE